MNQMKVLIVGGGGREHAIAWKLRQSPRLGKLFVAPGNAGTAQIAENVPVKATDIEGLLAFALKEGIGLTIVGPDDSLALGIVDAFQAKGLRIFGPTKAAAQIEASKVFSKELMEQCEVPTARFHIHTQHSTALEEVQKHFALWPSSLPMVIKASGLALGKGVCICRNVAEAEQALDEIMVKKLHGDAGNEVIIEEYVDGQEISIHAFCDGKSFKLFPSAHDHKPIFDDDKGPNTGGMGTIAPVPWFHHHNIVSEKVIDPILKELQKNDSPFVGLLYPGLKVSMNPPSTIPDLTVLEFNARFGDPETQVYMRLLKTDLLDIFEACVDGRLHEINIEWNPGFAACIVMASAGYPSPDYEKGLPITGIDNAEIVPGVVVFHAGTKNADGQLVTSGGRVLGVTGIGATLPEALDHAYKGVKCIHFEDSQYRKDIGAKSIGM